MTIDNSDGFLKIRKKKDEFEYFSKGILSSSLYSIGIDANLALEVANKVEDEWITKISDFVTEQLNKHIQSSNGGYMVKTPEEFAKSYDLHGLDEGFP